MKLKIACFVHGRGRGHATRTLTIGKMLISQGKGLHVYAGRDAYPVLQSHMPTTLIDSIFPSSGPFLFVQRFIQDIHRLKKEQVNCVISDGDAPCVWAAKLLGIHVVSIGHGMIFPYGIHPFPLNRWALFKESFKAKVATQLSDFKLIVHFCRIELNTSKAVLVKPSIPTLEKKSNKDYLISYFRDGNGTPLIQQLTKRGVQIKNFGSPIELTGVENHVLSHSNFKSCLQQAKGIVGSSGSNLIFEGISLNIPLLLTFKENDFEQETNAKYVEHLNAGFGFPINKINQGKIDAFIALLSGKEKTENELEKIPSLEQELSSHLELTFYS